MPDTRLAGELLSIMSIGLVIGIAAGCFCVTPALRWGARPHGYSGGADPPTMSWRIGTALVVVGTAAGLGVGAGYVLGQAFDTDRDMMVGGIVAGVTALIPTVLYSFCICLQCALGLHTPRSSPRNGADLEDGPFPSC